ncbi:hypothetical protein M422DRAFT_249480 [Sphaerobolus stellatus SS14]|uniref:Integrase catalytic domain-containing protein n=1 Tax=Sphaerobolus stellatus (strain SS14) TaxID=990650 RepID=A0A0C9UUK9_SPHS4|nr:hypothetical protein M422DRAFT_249480 [Sphaerobolus stellatus SS14]
MSDSESDAAEELEDSEALPPHLFIPNPHGLNQYTHCPSKDDERTKRLICEYDKQGVKSPEIISQLLWAEHGIRMRTVSRHKKDYNLMNSHMTTETLPDTVKQQLVLDELARDPGRRQGPPLIKEAIRMRTGIDLTRDFVEKEMRFQDPEGFQLRDPTSKRIKRRALVNIGIHEEWSGDGHDKLKRIGLAIYGIRDVWSGKWLGLWVIPDNRLKDAVAYLWLSLVEEYGGLPIQTTTDCGSETTMIYGLGTALREAFFPDFPLKFQFDANVDEFWDNGFIDGIYDPYDDRHISLARWLWSRLVQKEITAWKERFNAHTPRKDPKKVNPSGVSPNIAFALCERYHGINCLRELTEEARKLVSDLKKELRAEELLRFVPPAFAERCEEALASLKIQTLAFTNVWSIFQAMLPLVFEEEL